MDLVNYVVVGTIIVLAIIYLILIPILKRRNMKNAQEGLDNFYQSLKIGDVIVLSDGIKGKIVEERSENEYAIEIAKGVKILVNKFGIVNKE